MNIKTLALLAAVAATLASCTAIENTAKEITATTTETGTGQAEQKLTLEQIDFLAKKNLECNKAIFDEKDGVAPVIKALNNKSSTDSTSWAIGEIYLNPKDSHCNYTVIVDSSRTCDNERKGISFGSGCVGVYMRTEKLLDFQVDINAYIEGWKEPLAECLVKCTSTDNDNWCKGLGRLSSPDNCVQFMQKIASTKSF